MKLGLIINRKAARCSGRLVRQLHESLTANVKEIRETDYANHATIIAREMADTGVDAIVAVGGDGTVNEVLNGTIGSTSALAIVPCGTANDLAHHLGIPRNVEGACEVIRRGCIRQIDLISVNGWYLATTGGFGVACDVIRLVENFKRTRAGRRVAALTGSTLYLLALIAAGLRHRRDATSMHVGGGTAEYVSAAFSLTLSNIPRLAGHFNLAPKASDHDGFVDLCCIENGRGLPALVKSIAMTLSGSHEQETNVRVSMGHEFLITCDSPVALFGDGLIREYSNRFQLQVIPSALPVMVPSRGDGGAR